MKNKKKNKKKLNEYPTGIDRMDKELLAEIKLYYTLCQDIAKTANAYHVTENMVRFALNKGIEFDKIGVDKDDYSKRHK